MATGLLSGMVVLCQLVFAEGPPNAGTTLRDINTPKDELSAPALPAASLQLPAAPKPQESDTNLDTSVVINAFRFTGNTVFSNADLQALLPTTLGLKRSLTEIRAIAQVVTTFYREHGYPVARAFIPAQSLTDGVVEIAILEGRYGQVILDNKSIIPDAVLAPYLRSKKIGLTIDQARLNRAVLLLQELTQDPLATASLKPGAETGTADLVMQLHAAQRLIARLEADNYGSKATGRNRLGAALQWNSPLGLGDRMDARLITSLQGQDYARVAYSMPVGSDGLRAAIAYAESRYRVGGDFSALDVFGRATVWTANATYPLLRSPANNLWFEFNIDHKRLDDRVGAIGSSNDKSNDVVGIGVTAEHNGPDQGSTTFNTRLDRGRLRLGNAEALSADGNTTRTAGQYTKLTYAVTHYRPLTTNSLLLFSLNGQQASRNLDSSEKISLGGPYAVRAYPVGEAAGDSGYVATIEFRRLLDQKILPVQATILVFVDTGAVRINKQPYADVRNHLRLSSIGWGAMLLRPDWLEIHLVYAKALGQTSILTDNDRASRVWLYGSSRF